MNLVVDVVDQQETSTVHLSGEVDAYTAPELKAKLLPLTYHQGHTVNVDLKDVTYMDSTGLGVFISALKSTNEHESKLKLINIQERVLRLFKITGLDEIMDIDAGIRGGNV
ncbi:STAS domain-containing protein [Virgibacillus sp. NKC19-3]|uniref:STAS domain-containing protein n=1 Tax=Virgibacillus saliphilus TaxID=2831674 RepID=UPI001C9A6DE7|nr:STAS domain-containing protein [Virgibacillus sp. NKC19-3]MBY7142394.1 STAS domain-containing protein [Virgibacillus sp. NKC19-3]